MDRAQGLYHAREAESAATRRVRQWEAIKPAMHKAASTGGEFAHRLQAAGIALHEIQSLDDFARIPVIRKKDLSRLQQEHGLSWFLTCAPGQLSRIYQSPGPLYDPEGRGADYWGWAEAFFAAGFRSGDMAQMTFSYHLTPAGLMLEEPLRALGCAVIPAGPGNSAVQIQFLRELPVTGFVGMTTFLKTLGEKARAQGLDPRRDFQLRVAFVAAERLPESLRTEVQDMFDMIIRQGYGTADVGCIAYECTALGGMHLSTRCLVEICDPQTGAPLPPGELGEVVVTPFTQDYPLIRLATGDLSKLSTDPCACGRTAPKLMGILGRVDDTAKVRGQFIYPSQMAEVIRRFPQVAAYQLVIDNPGGKDGLHLHVELREPIDTGALSAAFQEKLKLRPTVLTLEPGRLPDNAPPLIDQRSYE